MLKSHSQTTSDTLFSPSADQNDAAEAREKGTNGVSRAVTDTEPQPIKESTSAPKPVLKMSFAEYRKISNLIVLHMHRMEESELNGTRASSDLDIICIYIYYEDLIRSLPEK